MNFNEYQKLAVRSARYPNQIGILYCALKLNGEAGEVAEKVGKLYRDEGGAVSDAFRRSVLLELGDVLWYVSALATELTFTLGEVAEANLEKLSNRMKKGTIHGSGDSR